MTDFAWDSDIMRLAQSDTGQSNNKGSEHNLWRGIRFFILVAANSLLTTCMN